MHAITEFTENLKLHYGVLNGIQGVLGDVKSAVQQLSEIEQNRALSLSNSRDTPSMSMSYLAVVLGDRKAEIHACNAAKRLNVAPWKLDEPIWTIGSKLCSGRKCGKCPVEDLCDKTKGITFKENTLVWKQLG